MSIIEDIYEPCGRPNPQKASADVIAAFKVYPVGKELPKDLQLDRDHTTRLGDKNYDDPLKLFYGCGVNVQDFLDYHQRHNLLRPPPMHSRPALWKYMTDQVLEDLREHCEFDLFRLIDRTKMR